MNEEIAIGTVFEQDGFRGEVIEFLSGLIVVETQLKGTVAAHASDRDEFTVVLQGEIIVTIDGVHKTVTAGHSIIVLAGKLHEVTAASSARLVLIY